MSPDAAARRVDEEMESLVQTARAIQAGQDWMPVILADGVRRKRQVGLARILPVSVAWWLPQAGVTPPERTPVMVMVHDPREPEPTQQFAEYAHGEWMYVGECAVIKPPARVVAWCAPPPALSRADLQEVAP